LTGTDYSNIADQPWTLRTPVVGLLTPYFPFFDNRFPPSFRRRQEMYAASLAERVRRMGFEVAHSGLIDSEAAGREAGSELREARAEVVLVAPTMACPPTYTLPALDLSPATPVILVQDQRLPAGDRRYSELVATEYSNLLGCVMIGNALRRSGREYAVLPAGDGHDDDSLARAVRGAAAAASLHGLRIGRIGQPIPGYLDGVVDAATAARLGVTWTEIPTRHLVDAMAAVREPELDRVRARLGRQGLPVAPIEGDAALQSFRLCSVLARAARDHDVSALTINCHGPEFRQNDQIGVCGCLAASLLAGEGVPVACTGDAATTISLMVASRLGGIGQYCEAYLLERVSGELLLGSCGLGDARLAAAANPPLIRPNTVYGGVLGDGYSLYLGLPAGPATIISFTPAGPQSRPTLVAGYGVLSGRSYEEMVGPNGTFRFAADPVESVLEWNRIAPAHHLALTLGLISPELRAFARFAGVDLVEIGDPN